jgi:AcrR family transcriptional regulator
MKTTSRREREKEELRRRILDAARTLFASEGYEAVTMREIAGRIDYTPAALYFHFRDKQTLFAELCAEDFGALAARFQVLTRVPDPVERLRMLGRAYIGFAVEHPNHYRLMFLNPPTTPSPERTPSEPVHPGRDALSILRRTVEEAIAAGRLRPEHRDADLVAQALWAGVHGVASLHVARREGDGIAWRPVAACADAVLDALLRGLEAERG